MIGSLAERTVRVVGVLALVLVVAGCTSAPAGDSGEVLDERFAPCPDSPNCVSSFAEDELHAIEPLPLPSRQPMDTLQEIVASMPRTTIVTVDGDYLHVVYRTLVFRFADDVEFRIDEAAGVIHVRSASRVGYGDMGVNRNRVEAIRDRLQE